MGYIPSDKEANVYFYRFICRYWRDENRISEFGKCILERVDDTLKLLMVTGEIPLAYNQNK